MVDQTERPEPYVGPRPFKRDESEVFFGRRLEVNDLISLVTAYQVVLLYAQSGAGKTSLLQASLIPRLEDEENFHVIPPARVRGQGTLKIASQEIKNIFIFNVLSEWAGESFTQDQLAQMSLAEFIEWYKGSVGKEALSAPWIMIFDQFEELFTHHPDRWEDRQGFFEQVSEVLEKDTHLRVVFAMREDYIAELDPYAQMLPGKLRTRIRMERLRRASALEAIKDPLEAPSVKVLGRHFDTGVAEALVEDLLKIRVQTIGGEKEVTGQFVEPVQLQVVCQTLWQELKPEDKLITFDHLRAYGDVNEALTKFYERNIKEAAELSGISEGALRRWFDRTMITPEGNRSTVLRGNNETAGIPNAAIDVLEAKRLLRSEPRDGRLWYELGQDRFIKPIQESYKRWLAEQPGDEQTRLRLENQADTWVRTGRRDSSLLLDQGELLVAKRWMEAEATTGGYSDALYALVQASEAEITRIERERERHLAKEQALRAAAETERAEALEQKAQEQERRIQAEREHAKEQRRLFEIERERTEERRRLAEESAAVRQREAEQAKALALAKEKVAEKERQRAEDKAKALRWAQALMAGLGFMALLTAILAVYAFTKRAQAQDNYRQALAASQQAEERRKDAEREKERAEAGERDATEARKVAEERRLEAEDQKKIAEEKTALAKREKAQADIARQAAVRAQNEAIAARNREQGLKEKALQAQTQAENARSDVEKALKDVQVQRDISKSRELSANALMQLNNDPELSLLLALAAAEKRQTSEAQEALRQALAKSLLRSTIKETNTDSPDVLAATFSPDGQSVLTANANDIVQQWNVPSERSPQQSIRSVQGLDKEARTIAFSPDAKSVVTIDSDNTAHVWRLEGDSRPISLTGQRVRSAAFSADGKYVVTTSDDGPARIWEASTGRRQIVLRPENSPSTAGQVGADDTRNVQGTDDTPLTGAAFSHDGKYVVTTSVNDAQIWNIGQDSIQNTGTVVTETIIRHPQTTLAGHVGRVNSAAFSPDGKLLVTTSDDKTARLWNVEANDTIKLKYQLLGHEGRVTTAAFSPNSNFVATTSDDKTARVWDVKTGRSIAVLRGHGGPVTSATFSADNKFLVTTGADKTTKVWELGEGNEPRILSGHQEELSAVVLSPDGRFVVTTSFDKTARVWDVATRQKVAEFRGHDGPVVSAAFSPDGKYIVTASDDKTARVWDAQTGQVISILRGHELEVSSASFSPDGKQVLTVSLDGTVRIWDAATGHSINILTPPDNRVLNPVTGAVFSANGRFIALAYFGDNIIYIRDARTGQQSSVLRGHTGDVRSLRLSPDGKALITASGDGTARIWNISSNNEVLVLDNGSRIALRGAAFSPDGKYVVTWGERAAWIWDAATGHQLTAFSGHADIITSIAFSPDSRLMITASNDGTAHVWDIISGESLAELQDHQRSISGVTFGSTSKLIVTASFDKTALIYNCTACSSIDDFEELARKRSRPMTQDERARYLNDDSTDNCLTCSDLPARIMLANTRVTRPLTDAEKIKFLNDSQR